MPDVYNLIAWTTCGLWVWFATLCVCYVRALSINDCLVRRCHHHRGFRRGLWRDPVIAIIIANLFGLVGLVLVVLHTAAALYLRASRVHGHWSLYPPAKYIVHHKDTRYQRI